MTPAIEKPRKNDLLSVQKPSCAWEDPPHIVACRSPNAFSTLTALLRPSLALVQHDESLLLHRLQPDIGVL
jgi:hypothetical protein